MEKKHVVLVSIRLVPPPPRRNGMLCLVCLAGGLRPVFFQLGLGQPTRMLSLGLLTKNFLAAVLTAVNLALWQERQQQKLLPNSNLIVVVELPRGGSDKFINNTRTDFWLTTDELSPSNAAQPPACGDCGNRAELYFGFELGRAGIHGSQSTEKLARRQPRS